MNETEGKKKILGVTFEGSVTFNGPMFDIHDNQHVHIGVDGLGGTQTKNAKLPTPQVMVEAVEDCMNRGLFYAGRAWAVVFRVYQKAGYKGSVSNFVREANKWPWKRKLTHCLNDDAVSRPLRDGRMAGDMSQWEADGVPKRNRVLAEALMVKLGIG